MLISSCGRQTARLWVNVDRQRESAYSLERCCLVVSGRACAWWVVLAPSPRTTMSAIPSTSTSRSSFVSIFNAALETYKHKTEKDLASHPLLPRLQSCDSPDAILTVLREEIPAFNQSENGDDGLTKWVTPTINVLHAFSATLGQVVGHVNIRLFLRTEFRL